MPNNYITYDTALMRQSGRRGAGLTDRKWQSMLAGLKPVLTELKRQRRKGKIGFLQIPELKDELRRTEALAKELAVKYRTLVVIGIGGSDLGARALIRALRPLPSRPRMEVRFIGANTDPEEIAELLETVDLKRSVLNVVSKSGSTIEPMSTFLLLRDRLVKAAGKGALRRQIVATTDQEGGTLRQLAEKEGYRQLPVPSAIGGRFSALTPVGLFPAACAGLPVRRMIKGATEEFEAFFSSPVGHNQPLLFAGLHHHALKSGWGSLCVLMPYVASLQEIGAWFVQLWAESLGKELDRQGNKVNVGQTPIGALGATDQHSQVQLYSEGPADKVFTFIEAASLRNDFRVPKTFPEISGIAYLGGHRFSDILHIEREATAEALYGHGRPSGTLIIPKVSPESVGSLMAFFMLATAAMGELLNVNAYDQPGVEAGKRIMYRRLGRPGS